VWKATRILLDGYSRFDICTRNGIAFWVLELPVAGREAARAWILAHQTGQRTLTPNGLSYIRGLCYLLEKQSHGGDHRNKIASDQNDHLHGESADPMKTEQRLAREYGLSGVTMRRSAKFAEAVEQITANCGHDAKELFFAPEGWLTCKDALSLARRGPGDQRQFLEDWQKGERCKPWVQEKGEASIRVPRDLDKLFEGLIRDVRKENMRKFYDKMGSEFGLGCVQAEKTGS
jgi:hypothetical protein